MAVFRRSGGGAVAVHAVVCRVRLPGRLPVEKEVVMCGYQDGTFSSSHAWLAHVRAAVHAAEFTRRVADESRFQPMDDAMIDRCDDEARALADWWYERQGR